MVRDAPRTRTPHDHLGIQRRERFETWIGSPRHVALVAELHADIVGFGLMHRDARIALWCVSPAVRFRGVSRALLTSLEARAREVGLHRLTLGSTATARTLYASAGYVADGTPTPGFGRTTVYPMAKSLWEGRGADLVW